jgi:hypothetical protein
MRESQELIRAVVNGDQPDLADCPEAVLEK